MEQKDLELIERYSNSDPALAKLYKEHLEFERQLGKLENKSFLTPQEQFEWREVKKKKLAGRDRMEAMLKKYRQVSV